MANTLDTVDTLDKRPVSVHPVHPVQGYAHFNSTGEAPALRVGNPGPGPGVIGLTVNAAQVEDLDRFLFLLSGYFEILHMSKPRPSKSRTRTLADITLRLPP